MSSFDGVICLNYLFITGGYDVRPSAGGGFHSDDRIWSKHLRSAS
jgi:hypothetical protein